MLAHSPRLHSLSISLIAAEEYLFTPAPSWREPYQPSKSCSESQKLAMTMDDEFLILEYPYIGPPTKEDARPVLLPGTFQAP
jgi:hypothetical protein